MTLLPFLVFDLVALAILAHMVIGIGEARAPRRIPVRVRGHETTRKRRA